jgi:hypothetical protein
VANWAIAARLAAALAVALLAWPAQALACACCATKGDYSFATEAIKQFEVKELVRLKFAPKANLRMGAGFPDDVKGLKHVAPTYSLTQFRHGLIWVLTLKDGKGHADTVSFVLPQKATKLAADVQDGRTAAGGGPLLYREWTLRGKLSGTATTAPATFRLILQGRGNSCMNAHDFRSWILQASGPKVSYTLYGKFVPVPL